MAVGVDSGGTFTDAVADDGRILKVSSTADPSVAVRAAVDTLAGYGPGARPDRLAHGTTVATNALLERTLARVALITSAGVGDVIEIGRQRRPRLFDHRADRPDPLVARDDRIEIDERVAADGTVLAAPDVDRLADPPDGVEGVAVCLLHADLHPGHEQTVAAAYRARGHRVVASHEVAAEHREFERTVTTVIDAALAPLVGPALHRLDGVADRVDVMTSAGGLVPLEVAAGRPASLLLSGPAAGVAAAAAAARANGFGDVVSFDMGGTSTDVCLVVDGRPAPAAQRDVGGFPVRLPALDIHTVGAGGGSIARIDAGGALTVGPASAGARPGPCCYGRGGTEPTVTDADLVAGRIPADARFGDLGTLDVDAAAAALARAGTDARSVIAVVDAAMAAAIRVVTVERGVDPRTLGLVAFGGAGPLHACGVAELLGMATVIVPARAGVLSAVGLLGAAEERRVVRSWPGGADHAGLDRFVAEAVDEALAALAGAEGGGDAEFEVGYDCRYAGQGHELIVASPDDFGAAHRRANGFDRQEAVEVVAVRVRAWRALGSTAPLPAADRVAVDGPAVVADDDCTICVPAGWSMRPGVGGASILERR